MDGVFKGWLAGKPYCFIAADDGGADVLLHQNKVSTLSLAWGAFISFEVEETPKGRRAIEVSLLSAAQRKRGRVKFWNTVRGFGFIEPLDGSRDVFVALNAVPTSEGGYLSEGLTVEFSPMPSQREGYEARDLVVVGWSKPSDRLMAFADMGHSTGWLKALADLAETEPWEYSHASSTEPLPILHSYLRYTFQRLEEMPNGIAISNDKKAAAINTGLVTPNQEEIYAMFAPNKQPGRQSWRLHGFKKASDWDLIDRFGSSPPPLANYFDDPSVLLYDRRCELYINIDHVMEQIGRFPKHLQANPYVARQLMISAEATTKKRVYRNYKTAVPQYYRDKGRDGSVQLLLPICLENPGRADLALVVAKTEGGNAYRGSTVLTLDMAYNNSRLLSRPDTEWLQP
jgi:cold shock CspA family protein